MTESPRPGQMSIPPDEPALQSALEEERALRLQAEKELEELRSQSSGNDELISLIAHELRTPITVILGYVHLLRRSMADAPQPQVDAIAEIRSEAERLNRIITDLLVLARTARGQSPDLDPIVFVPIVQKVIDEHRRRYPHRELILDFHDQNTPSIGNQVYVEQIISNLLANAEKYSPEDKPIEVRLAVEGGVRAVRIWDRGIGIAKEDVDKLFDAFYRSEQARNVSQGLGIGLAVCKRLVEVQDGEIWANSRDGGGAEFGFSLPIIDV